MTVDERLFHIADSIARQHVKPGWFESTTSLVVRIIKLRQAIYNELWRATSGDNYEARK